MDHDLGLDDRPDDEEFDDFLLHVDGWLCEIKDAQIRDGLHVLGQAPAGEARVNLVLAILRAPQVWGGQASAVPGLRAALGLKEGAEPPARSTQIEERRRALVAGDGGRRLGRRGRRRRCTDEPRGAAASLEFAARRWCRGWPAPPTRSTRVLHALAGGFVPAGPSGSPLRGLVNVLPTGRNFYSVDPKAVPSRLAWETGQAMADSLLERYLDDTGTYPSRSACRCGAPRAMRTSGDDIAEVLALLGVRPVWDEASRRVSRAGGDPARRARPAPHRRHRAHLRASSATPSRTSWRCSTTRCGWSPLLDEPDEDNYVRAHAAPTSPSTATSAGPPPGSSAPSPGSYGAGHPAAHRGRHLAQRRRPGRGLHGLGRLRVRARARRQRRRATTCATNYRRIEVAAKNIDTREHDIADSDDYFQYHGGMVATVRALTGSDPEGLRRRLDHARTRSAPARWPRRPPGSSGPGWSTRAGSRRCAARLQGRLRARRHRRLPLRLRRHRPAWCTTGCTSSWPSRTCSTRRTGTSSSRTRGRCAASSSAARGRRPRPVGGARSRRLWPRCSRSTWTSRATSRTGPVPEPVRVRILGVGMGPQHVTPEVADALRSVDYVLAADKGSDGDDDGLLALRREIVEAHTDGSVDVVPVRDPQRDRATNLA